MAAITVEELIDILQNYPPDMKIAISGTEGGFNDITFVDEMVLALDYNDSRSSRGIHEDFDFAEIMLGEDDDMNNYEKEEYLVIK